jgi:hypothetical protein
MSSRQAGPDLGTSAVPGAGDSGNSPLFSDKAEDNPAGASLSQRPIPSRNGQFLEPLENSKGEADLDAVMIENLAVELV